MAQASPAGLPRQPLPGHAIVSIFIRDDLGFTYTLDRIHCPNGVAAAAVEYLSLQASPVLRDGEDVETLKLLTGV